MENHQFSLGQNWWLCGDLCLLSIDYFMHFAAERVLLYHSASTSPDNVHEFCLIHQRVPQNNRIPAASHHTCAAIAAFARKSHDRAAAALLSRHQHIALAYVDATVAARAHRRIDMEHHHAARRWFIGKITHAFLPPVPGCNPDCAPRIHSSGCQRSPAALHEC